MYVRMYECVRACVHLLSERVPPPKHPPTHPPTCCVRACILLLSEERVPSPTHLLVERGAAGVPLELPHQGLHLQCKQSN